MTPYEAWFGRKPSLAHLRPFGCPAYAYVPPELRKKLDSRTRRCILLGYVHVTTKMWRLWDPARKHIFDCSSVTFAEYEMPPIRALLLQQQQHSPMPMAVKAPMPALSPRDPMLKAQNLPKLQFPIQGPSLPVQDRMPKAQQLSKSQLSNLAPQEQLPKLQLIPAPCPQDLMPKAQLQKAQLLGTCDSGRQVTDTYVSVVGCKTGTNEEPFTPPVRTAASNARAEAILQSLKPMVSRTKKALIAAPAAQASAPASARAPASNARIQDLVTLQTYKQALRSNQCLQWQEAMKEEHESLMLNGT